MWTATLISATKQYGRLDFVIEYVDDVDNETLRRKYSLASPTRKAIRDLARNEVVSMDALKQVNLNLPIGASIDIDPDVIVPPTPTPEEIAKVAWVTDYRRLQVMLRVTTAVPALLTAQAQTGIDNLRTTLEANWLNGYLSSL